MKPSGLAILAVLAGALILFVPALYNGYPFTFWDTRAYVEHAFTLLPRPDRLIGYSLFLRALAFERTLWFAAFVQCALVSWLIWLWMGGVPRRATPARHLAVMAMLTVFTALPWVAAQLIADVFTPVLVLSLYLVIEEERRGFVRGVLLVLLAVCVMVHLSHLWLGVGLLVLALIFLLVRREKHVIRRVGTPAAALFAGVVAIAAFNYSRDGKVALAPGSSAFILAHLIETGIASAELDAHCPERDYWLCPKRDQLPMPGDSFLWVDKLDLQPWLRLGEVKLQTQELVRDSLLEYPWLHLKVSANYTFQSFFAFGTGEAFDTDATLLIEEQLHRYLPADVSAFRASREQTARLPLPFIRAVNWAGTYLLLLGAIAGFIGGVRKVRPRFDRPATRFVLLVFAALVVNAVICGNLAGIHDRYQSRLMWLVGLAAFAFWSERLTAPLRREAE